jgi:glycosyltransferase involved in cell wall biosynthesis
MTKLTLIIVTRNEAHNIADCIRSVHFADEIIVYDSSSTDNTVEICRQFKALVTITADWPGDGAQKNRALTKATGEWVLCLDADERVSPALAKEIQAIILKTTDCAFDIPYQSTYCRKIIRFGDWRGESHRRLFKRANARFSEDIVHCHLQVEGRIGRLKHPILHHPFHHLDAMIYKMNDYSTQGAKSQFKKGKKASFWTAISHSLWTFIRGYFIKLGCLDGREGFMLAMSNAHGTYYRYLKLMYLCEQSDAKDPLHG